MKEYKVPKIASAKTFDTLRKTMKNSADDDLGICNGEVYVKFKYGLKKCTKLSKIEKKYL